MPTLNRSAVALAVGTFAAFWHLVWSVLVAMKLAEPLAGWVLALHSVAMPMQVAPFEAGRSLLLIVVAFVVGYVVGWVFAAIWNGLRD